MKQAQLKSTLKIKSPIGRFFGFLFILLILSISFGVSHGFAKDKKISGYVRTSSGHEIGGVTITFSNGEGTITTDSAGYYIQKVKEGWSGTATPSKVGYNFDPASRSYSKVKRDQKGQDYTGTLQKRTISGYVRTLSGDGFSGVTVTFDNDGGTAETNSSGYYSQDLDNGWSGTVTPTESNYTFEPPSRNYSNVTSNISNQNYTGSATVRPKVTISGYVRTSSGSGIEDVVLTFSNGGGTAETNSSGYYSQSLDNGWSGTVTPAKGGYSFIPVVRNYSNLTTDQKNQDYTESVENERYGITIYIVGEGTIQLNPNQDSYTQGSLISVAAIADIGWVFGGWRGDINSLNDTENISIISDMVITAVFLEDNDNDGVSDEEENSNPANGDGNRDGILDSLQSNVTSKLIYSTNKYVTFETPVGTSINSFENLVDPLNNYPNDVQFSYGFFSFILKGISTGDSTSVTFYFPSDTKFNTYYKYGPTPDDQIENWYEFIYDNSVGAEINGNIITLHFVDGEKGDDDLTKNGIIIDMGGPGNNIKTFSEASSQQVNGGTDRYGCFIECLY